MPKRSCPFTETFSSQYKMHIGQYELNNCSVFGNKYRKEMYEKTKTLLCKGAQAVVDTIWTGEDKTAAPQPAGQASPVESGQTLLRGQTLIGPDGRLTKAARTQGPSSSGCCCVCLRSVSCQTSCSQCERRACLSCSRQCSICFSQCCSVCTIIDYSGRYDEVLCCSCST